MRHVLQGAVCAGLLYPVLWYCLSQGMDGSDAVPAEMAPAAVSQRSRAPESPSANRVRPSPVAPPSAGRRGAAESKPPTAASVARLATEPVRYPAPPTVVEPRVAAPTEPTVPVPLPPALPQLLSKVADVQAVASDPNALADRVQKFDMSPEEIAQLKAFAEQFVRLPPSSADPYVPGAASQGR